MRYNRKKGKSIKKICKSCGYKVYIPEQHSICWACREIDRHIQYVPPTPPPGTKVYQDACPQCGKWKETESKMCKDCWFAQSVVYNANPVFQENRIRTKRLKDAGIGIMEYICPECGSTSKDFVMEKQKATCHVCLLEFLVF